MRNLLSESVFFLIWKKKKKKNDGKMIGIYYLQIYGTKQTMQWWVMID